MDLWKRRRAIFKSFDCCTAKGLDLTKVVNNKSSCVIKSSKKKGQTKPSKIFIKSLSSKIHVKQNKINSYVKPNEFLETRLTPLSTPVNSNNPYHLFPRNRAKLRLRLFKRVCKRVESRKKLKKLQLKRRVFFSIPPPTPLPLFLPHTIVSAFRLSIPATFEIVPLKRRDYSTRKNEKFTAHEGMARRARSHPY